MSVIVSLFKAICPIAHPWESLVIGTVGGCCACFGRILMFKLRIDDPTSCIAVHTLSGIWGLLAVGLFIEEDQLETFSVFKGVFKGGNGYLLGVQTLAAVSLAAWSAITAALILFAIKYTIGLRMTEEEEKLGADYVEHEMDFKKGKETQRQNALRGLNQFLRKKIEPLRSPSPKKRNADFDVGVNPKAFTIKIDRDEKEMTIESVGSESSSPYSLLPGMNASLRQNLAEERKRRLVEDEEKSERRKSMDPSPILLLPKATMNS